MPRLFKPLPSTPALKKLQKKASGYLIEIEKALINNTLSENRVPAFLQHLKQLSDDPEYRHLSPRMKKRINKAQLKLFNRLTPNEVLIDSDTEIDELFLTDTDDLPELETLAPPLMVQIPSATDLTYMRGMIAGTDEDQAERLGNMTRLLHNFPNIPIVTTDALFLNPSWNELFKAIDNDTPRIAARLFSEIPDDDPILKPLLAVHTRSYLKKLVLYSVSAHRKGLHALNDDVVVTPKTFELLIRDLATSILIPAPVCFSFGLPGHHAFSDRANGFCLINKTAVMMQHMANNSPAPLKFIVIGLDVNRDDGLCNVLREKLSHLDICHVDVFDSRVYPMDGSMQIDQEFGVRKPRTASASNTWKQGSYVYYAQDLSLQETQKSPANPGMLHPAIDFAVTKAQEEINRAIRQGKKVALLLPTGWDSHCKETADCSKMFEHDELSEEESRVCRFNDRDFGIFNYLIMMYFQDNREHMSHLYWGLEGGYERGMYEFQARKLLEAIDVRLINKPAEGPASSSHVEDDAPSGPSL